MIIITASLYPLFSPPALSERASDPLYNFCLREPMRLETESFYARDRRATAYILLRANDQAEKNKILVRILEIFGADGTRRWNGFH